MASILRTIKNNLPSGKTTIILYTLLCTALTLIGYLNIIKATKNMEILETIEPTGTTNIKSGTDVLIFFIYILIATFFLIIIFKLIQFKIILMLFEFFMVFFPAMIFIAAMLVPFLNPTDDLLYMTAGSTAFFIFIVKQLLPSIKDAVTIINASGIAISILASFPPQSIIIIAIFLVAYDFLAVFVTKHMLFFAKKIVAYNLPMTVSAFTEPAEIRSGQAAQDKEGKKQRIDLGSGDLIMFAVMSITNFVMFGIIGLMLSIIFGCISMYIMLAMVIKKKMIFPALLAIIPPMILVYAIMSLFFQLFGVPFYTTIFSFLG